MSTGTSTCDSKKTLRGLLQGPGGHIKPIPDDEDFAATATAPPPPGTRTGTDHEAQDRALAVRLQQARSVRIPMCAGACGALS